MTSDASREDGARERLSRLADEVRRTVDAGLEETHEGGGECTDTHTLPAFSVESEDEKRKEPWRLVVLGPSGVETRMLSGEGSITIGRADNASIRIEDPLVSRVHASIEIKCAANGEWTFWLRDLRSQNGTFVGGRRLDPDRAELVRHGDPITFGETTLLIQRGGAPRRMRRLASHDYFELRVEEESERSRESGRAFAILRLQITGKEAAIEQALTTFLSPRDFVALYAPGDYEIMLTDSAPEQAEEAVAALRFALTRIAAEVRIGIACFPRDGHAGEELIAHANECVRGRTPEEVVSRSADVIVVDDAMRDLFKLASRVAPSDINVLILGETGAGKELLAKSIHAGSRRSEKTFVAVNCGALAPALLESELFGHERGAFTGAIKEKIGLLESADGGTLFLDEVGEMPMATQVSLLRALEERRVRRVGGVESRSIDVRFIAATNRDLEHEVTLKTFRSDLYYRLAGISLVVPPLRERSAEIPYLANAFARQYWKQQGRPGVPSFSRDAVDLLSRYSWPGNVRELRNVVERAVVLATSSPIGVSHLPTEKLSSTLIMSRAKPVAPSVGIAAIPAPNRRPETTRSIHQSEISASGRKFSSALRTLEMPAVVRGSEPDAGAGVDHARDRAPVAPAVGKVSPESERERIIAVLEACAGNQTRAAKMLGYSRRSLIYRLDRYGIPRPRKD